MTPLDCTPCLQMGGRIAGVKHNSASAAYGGGRAREHEPSIRCAVTDWRRGPRAKEKGVKCVINPDAHGVEKLQELWFGVGVARKGWLTKADVMNCLPLGKIEHELGRKRGR